MKSASVIVLATAVAAEYGYGAPSSSSKIGYTTVTPGYGKAPVTVTAQYQPIPTYVDGKWSQYEYISTVITDAYGKKITVTASDQYLTVYQTKQTITHSATLTGYAKPTGASYGNQTWNELYEETREVPYNHVGPNAIPGYAGNPKCEDNKDEQWVRIKKHTGGKWSTYVSTITYSVPKPSVTTYATPGVYTVPAKDITVANPTTYAVEQTQYAKAGEPVTYGGKVTQVTKPTTITAVYGAYETQGSVTKTVIRSTTIACASAGQYTIAKPTTTVYGRDTTVTYPSVTSYAAGVYHHSAETVTITKSNQPYTCSYEQTSAYPVPTYSAPSYSQAYGQSSSSSASAYAAYETSAAYSVPSASYTAPSYSTGVASSQGYEPSGAYSVPSASYTAPSYSTADASTGYPTPTGAASYSAPAYSTGTPTPTKPYGPDPSSDYEEPNESYGHASAGYIKRGGVLQRRKAESAPSKAGPKHAILV